MNTDEGALSTKAAKVYGKLYDIYLLHGFRESLENCRINLAMDKHPTSKNKSIKIKIFI